MFQTTARPGLTTKDEANRNALAWIGEVSLCGVVVHAHRVLGHIGADPSHVERHARETAAAGFAMLLRQVTGYDPDEWEDA